MADGSPLAQGVDYAFPPRPSIQGLVNAKKTFACRYGGPGSIDKQLDPVEAQQLSAAGIAIVANAEGSAGGLVGGYSTGASWARTAEARFKACGMPPGRPIYLSVDFDVQPGQWAAVASALRGAADVLGGVGRVGIYGGRHAIEWARRDGVAAWYWQTYAWSGGVWVPGNHIEQYQNGVSLAGADVDLDRALEADFGQWKVNGGSSMTQGDHNIGYITQNGLFGVEHPVAHIPAADGFQAGAWPSPFAEVLKALVEGRDAVLPAFAALPERKWINGTAARLTSIEAKLAALTVPAPAPVDPAVIEAAVKAALKDPAVLGAIATAVADEDHRRTAS